MVDTEADCTTVAETAGLACCGVSDGTGICFTDKENEQGHSCYAHKQGGTNNKCEPLLREKSNTYGHQVSIIWGYRKGIKN